jgi:hypothetical protein
MKPIYKSKTFWANAIAVGTLFVPGLREWQAVNPEAAVVALGAANILLRIVTHGKITIFAGGNDDDNGTGGCRVAVPFASSHGGRALHGLAVVFSGAVRSGAECAVSRRGGDGLWHAGVFV